MTASQIMCFARCLGLMIGDLIACNDKYWPLYTTLNQIVLIVLSPII